VPLCAVQRSAAQCSMAEEGPLARNCCLGPRHDQANQSARRPGAAWSSVSSDAGRLLLPPGSASCLEGRSIPERAMGAMALANRLPPLPAVHGSFRAAAKLTRHVGKLPSVLS